MFLSHYNSYDLYFEVLIHLSCFTLDMRILRSFLFCGFSYCKCAGKIVYNIVFFLYNYIKRKKTREFCFQGQTARSACNQSFYDTCSNRNRRVDSRCGHRNISDCLQYDEFQSRIGQLKQTQKAVCAARPKANSWAWA